MTTATSLILIAVGAVLAFAVSYNVAGINIQTVGVILIVVGAIGLAISVATLAGYAPWGPTEPGRARLEEPFLLPVRRLPPTHRARFSTEKFAR